MDICLKAKRDGFSTAVAVSTDRRLSSEVELPPEFEVTTSCVRDIDRVRVLLHSSDRRYIGLLLKLHAIPPGTATLVLLTS